MLKYSITKNNRFKRLLCDYEANRAYLTSEHKSTPESSYFAVLIEEILKAYPEAYYLGIQDLKNKKKVLVKHLVFELH